jgi:hypothetical protein
MVHLNFAFVEEYVDRYGSIEAESGPANLHERKKKKKRKKRRAIFRNFSSGMQKQKTTKDHSGPLPCAHLPFLKYVPSQSLSLSFGDSMSVPPIGSEET